MYILTETVTPAGFNTLEPIKITISFTPPEAVKDGTELCKWKIEAEGLTFTDNGSGVFATDIVNKSGSLLPSTGGIGTTIFYVIGGILVVAAGVLLVTKKRMKAE